MRRRPCSTTGTLFAPATSREFKKKSEVEPAYQILRHHGEENSGGNPCNDVNYGGVDSKNLAEDNSRTAPSENVHEKY
ncbi:hypothetical protein SMJ63A_60187 [Stenotrophomonas geniculata]